jgi:hypothetical protein
MAIASTPIWRFIAFWARTEIVLLLAIIVIGLAVRLI